MYCDTNCIARFLSIHSPSMYYGIGTVIGPPVVALLHPSPAEGSSSHPCSPCRSFVQLAVTGEAYKQTIRGGGALIDCPIQP